MPWVPKGRVTHAVRSHWPPLVRPHPDRPPPLTAACLVADVIRMHGLLAFAVCLVYGDGDGARAVRNLTGKVNDTTEGSQEPLAALPSSHRPVPASRGCQARLDVKEYLLHLRGIKTQS
ncbi:hypothetical protein MUK42_15717 [Musa troglodytarum]|uniref:Uncharacterized protein n=1 Tax=Musa troglodytarum TaxID=320322 RepID=A0A9E7HZB7_9LILI|nr:hypothetical protein MUK42_15717 [Musa troglodytarum]